MWPLLLHLTRSDLGWPLLHHLTPSDLGWPLLHHLTRSDLVWPLLHHLTRSDLGWPLLHHLIRSDLGWPLLHHLIRSDLVWPLLHHLTRSNLGWPLLHHLTRSDLVWPLLHHLTRSDLVWPLLHHLTRSDLVWPLLHHLTRSDLVWPLLHNLTRSDLVWPLLYHTWPGLTFVTPVPTDGGQLRGHSLSWSHERPLTVNNSQVTTKLWQPEDPRGDKPLDEFPFGSWVASHRAGSVNRGHCEVTVGSSAGSRQGGESRGDVPCVTYPCDYPVTTHAPARGKETWRRHELDWQSFSASLCMWLYSKVKEYTRRRTEIFELCGWKWPSFNDRSTPLTIN